MGDFLEYEGRTLDLHAELPVDAIDTGWRADDGSRLWRSADGSYVYLVRGRWVERWPWADPAPWCA